MYKIKGFTLIEVMIVVALIVIMAAVISGSLSHKKQCVERGGQWVVKEYESDGDVVYECAMPQPKPKASKQSQPVQIAPSTQHYKKWMLQAGDCRQAIKRVDILTLEGKVLMSESEQQIILDDIKLCEEKKKEEEASYHGYEYN